MNGLTPDLDREPAARGGLWRNARLVTLAPDRAGLGTVERGAVAVRDGRIVYAGPEGEMPASLRATGAATDCEGRWITPGLIDCHTHLVYAGDRAQEFERRLRGASYEEIARAGGGILSSVKALRAAGEERLVRETLPRLDALIAEGVTTIEIKSGYGLDPANERKSLLAARRLARERPIGVRTTFLGAHALPPEAAGDRRGFLDRLVEQTLPAIAAEGLADAVDGFCESIAFSPDEIARVFEAAQATRPAGEAACRSALQPARRGARRALWRPLRRSSGAYGRGRRRRDGQGRDRGDAVAGRLLFHSRDQAPADRTVPPTRRCDGGGDRLPIPAPRR